MIDINFLSKEYIPELGCYIKWLHGEPQPIEKIYCLTAFHFFSKNGGYVQNYEYQKYAEYMYLSILSILNSTTDWYVRLYIDESLLSDLNAENKIWKQKIELLFFSPRIQILCVRMPRYFNIESECHQGLLPVMFRYLALFDKNTSIILFRDIDNIWTEQHHYFVEKWLNEGTEDIFLFMNEKYKRQEIKELTKTGVILGTDFYTSILSGLWNIRKKIGYIFPYLLWYRMFAYIEYSTEFVYDKKYENCEYYRNRFTYGFDELMLTRIALPLFLDMGLKVYAIPIIIYDTDYMKNLFDEPSLHKFFKVLTLPQNISIIRNISIENYWHMNTVNAGLSEYILCILTNIYFKIITENTYFSNNSVFMNTLKYKIYNAPLLMGIGLFVFKNYNKYIWFSNNGIHGGSSIVNKFINNISRLSIQELTSNSDLSNGGDGSEPNYYNT